MMCKISILLCKITILRRNAGNIFVFIDEIVVGRQDI